MKTCQDNLDATQNIVNVDFIVDVSAAPEGIVKSVNNELPDSNGNVEIFIPSSENFATKEDLDAELNARVMADAELQNAINDLAKEIDLEEEVSSRENAHTSIEESISHEESQRQFMDDRNESDFNGSMFSWNYNYSEIMESLDKEITEREQGDNSISMAIDIEINRRTNSINQLDDKILEETNNRTNADNTLNIRISNEEATRINEDTVISQKINNEISNRISSDNLIREQVTVEKETRIEEDEILLERIEAEVALRTNSDIATSNKLSQDIVDRGNEENIIRSDINSSETRLDGLATNINIETETRTTSDSSLQAQIESIKEPSFLLVESYEALINIPISERKTNIIYLVSSQGVDPHDNKKEYLWTGESFELIGMAEIDLSLYAPIEDAEDVEEDVQNNTIIINAEKNRAQTKENEIEQAINDFAFKFEYL